MTTAFVPLWRGLHSDLTVDQWRADLASWLQEDYRRMLPGLPPLSDAAAAVEAAQETPARCESDAAFDVDDECDRVAVAVIRKGTTLLWTCQHHAVEAHAVGFTTEDQ